MPAATVHYEFAKDVYLNLPSNIADQITNLHMYYLGSQGPDLLFFNEAGITKKSLIKYGNLLHHTKVREVLAYLNEHTKYDSDLRSYYYGFIAHYSLDSITHPLINYSSKHILTKEEELINHFRVEAYFDRKLLESKGRDINTYDVYKVIKVSACDNVKLASMLQDMFITLFNIKLDFKRLQNTIKECPRYLGYIKPSNIKFKTIHNIENILKQRHFITGLMLNNELTEDVLNTSHSQWFNIYHPELTSNKSIFELYDEAIIKAKKLIANPSDEKLIDFTFNGTIIK